MKWLLVLAAVLVSGAAHAHTESAAHSRVHLEGHVAQLELRLRALDESALLASLGETNGVAAHVQRAVRIETPAGACVPSQPPQSLRLPDGGRLLRWSSVCPAPTESARLHVDLLFDVVAGHLHFARLGAETRVLTASERTAALHLPVRPQRAFTSAIPVGVHHILTGVDHVVFVLLLLLFGGSWRSLALVVSGFTVGHSVTLSLAVLGYASSHTRVVEALIGLSIAVVAAEAFWEHAGRRPRSLPRVAVIALAMVALAALATGVPGALAFAGVTIALGCYFAVIAQSERPARARAALAAVFGLVHGLGFAGALSDGGLQSDAIGYRLAGFNLGVEIGQLAILALALPPIAWWRRQPRRERALLELAPAAGITLGVYWLVSRTFS